MFTHLIFSLTAILLGAITIFLPILLLSKQYRVLLRAAMYGVIGFGVGTIGGLVFAGQNAPSPAGFLFMPAGIAIGAFVGSIGFIFGAWRALITKNR